MGPPWSKYCFHIWSVGYQNGVKRVRGVRFLRSFWKIFKNKDFGFDVFDKGQILRLFLKQRPMRVAQNTIRRVKWLRALDTGTAGDGASAPASPIAYI